MKNVVKTVFTMTPAVLAAFLALEQPACSSEIDVPQIPAPTESLNVPMLIWSARTQERTVAAGDEKAEFVFWTTNISTRSVLIMEVQTSCGCTVAKLEKLPFELVPGAQVPLHVTIKLRGKKDTVSKRVIVETSEGRQELIVKAHIANEGKTEDESDKNNRAQQAAAHDLFGLAGVNSDD